jgi:hypothetical protein
MTTPPDKPQAVDYGGYHRNADNLARLRAKAILADIAAGALIAAGIYVAIHTGQPAALLPFAVAAVAALVYGVSLWTYTTEVRHNLWRQEQAAGQDLDGDGHIGQPRKPRVRHINIAGQPVPFAEDDDDDPPPTDLVPGFELSPRDLHDLVEYAASRGLGRSKLVGITLPSGTRISKSRWETWNTEAAQRGWITPGGNGNGGAWAKTPASILAAIRQAERFPTGQPVQSTGRPAPPPASDRPQTSPPAGRRIAA